MDSGIIVYGTGGTSLDLLETLEAINLRQPTWNILGFVDDNPELTGQSVIGYPVLGTGAVLAAPPFNEAMIAIGVGNDRNLTVRRSIRGRLAALDPACGDHRFPTIVHPTASVSPRAQIGPGSVLLTGCTVGSEAIVGRHVLVMETARVGHHDIVRDFSTVGALTSLGGLVEIGEEAYLGMSCTVRPRLTIGAAARVGMGAAVIRNVEPGVTVAGVPARPLSKPG